MTLGRTKLLVGAELDGQDEHGQYVELKTYRILATPKDRISFERYKCLAFWIQSYLVGVPLIRCGFRDDRFRLCKEQTFELTALPQFGHKYWVLYE
jgi:RAT1-interacting protein